VKDAFGRVRTVLVLGGASEIAHATVEELARRAPLDVVLAARGPDAIDATRLERLGCSVDRVRFDAREFDRHGETLAGVFETHPDVDVVVAAFGILGEQARVEVDASAAVELAETNYVGAVSALTIVAELLRRQGHGTIVVLSSVAAQRARRSNYVYGSSKAGLDALAQGLRLRLHRSGVEVIVVRPGFVRTRMTAGLPPAPFATTAPVVARAIADAIPRGGGVVWVPPLLRYVMWVVGLLPPPLLRRL
jgi:decaprenylphospho-beta-D-erythro-pentofuranosid-2-ulose 2-reductase